MGRRGSAILKLLRGSNPLPQGISDKRGRNIKLTAENSNTVNGIAVRTMLNGRITYPPRHGSK
jgi:hypothetical protein